MTNTVMCAASDVRAYQNVHSGYKAGDDKIKLLIPSASSQIRTFCGRTFDRARYTQYFATPGEWAGPFVLRVKEGPILEDGTLELLYSPVADFRPFQAYVIPLSDVEVNYEDGTITIHNGLYEFHRKGFRVAYTGGYTATQKDGLNVLDVPTQVTAAAAMQVAAMLSKIGSNALGKTSANVNQGVTDSYDRGGLTGLIREVQGQLLPFRRTTLVGRT